jgi:hypothetical protein
MGGQAPFFKYPSDSSTQTQLQTALASNPNIWLAGPAAAPSRPAETNDRGVLACGRNAGQQD